MNTTSIVKVGVLDDGRIAVFPETKHRDYQHVYREAAGVYWDQDKGCFVSTSPKEWAPHQWYQHIIQIVKTGIGLQMLLTPQTKYESSELGFEDSIKLADKEMPNQAMQRTPYGRR